MARTPPPRRSRSPDHRRRQRSPSPSYRYDRSRVTNDRRSDDRRSARYDDDRDRDRYRERDRRDDRDRDRYTHRERERGDRRRSPSPERRRINRSSPPPRERPTSPKPVVGSASPSGNGNRSASPGPAKPLSAKERLEAWRKKRALETGKASPSTKESKADVKSSFSSITPVGKGSLPSKPASSAFSLGGLSRIGLPVKPGSHLKRGITALDDEEEEDRKLQKLDLPDVNPEVQSGEGANVDKIGDDLAAADVDEDEEEIVTPQIKSEVMDVDQKAEEDEVDPLDAFMAQTEMQKAAVDMEDARKAGVFGGGDDSDDEPDVENKQEAEILTKEALLQQAASRSRKKDLPPPDHSKITYEPFRKAFYSAPVEALDMDEEETELLRLEMDGIKIRGIDAPKPVKNWGAFGLSTAVLDIIRRNEWTAPTSIQAQAIPAIMSGRDVIGIAKTGSGKTIAFILPLLRHVKYQRPVANGEGPIAIILSPTRELAMQIAKEAKPFVTAIGLRIACCVGGSSISEDIAAMKKGAEVVVCTPGRMIDLLTANNLRVTNCKRCTYLVLDEADRMFDMGFEPQIMKIINNTQPTAQRVLFSATFPKDMEGLARRVLTRPLEITVGGRSVVAPEIDQRVEVRDADSRFNRLLEILGDMGENHTGEDGEGDARALIFVDRQEAADDLFRELLQKGYVCASLHGGKEQVDRDEAIKNFKNGDVPIIVATSVAARGLDVPSLKLVINYDSPNHMEDYVHRAGRTGRAGNKGVCITFISPEQDRLSVDIVRALEASKAFIPDDLKKMSDDFLAKIKSGKAKRAGTGYSGKGLERIERKRDEKDRAEKVTYGDTSEALSLSSREGAVIPYKPKPNGVEYKPHQPSLQGDADYTFTEINVEIIHGHAPDKATNPALYSASGNTNSKSAPIAALPRSTLDALEKAKQEGRHVDATNLAKVVAKLTQSIELTKAERLGLAAPADGPRRVKDPDATDWHAIFPINDYPQKARWKATNKEQMTLLAEISGASITMRGIFYPPGEEPKIGAEPKLHLLIESNDETRVRAAVDEIRRNLVDASMAALNNADRAIGAAGRYAV